MAFGYGFLSFFSPCTLPLVPVFIANLASPGVLEGKTKSSRFSIFIHSLVFVIGFSIIFTLFGAGAGLIGTTLSSHMALVRPIVGILLIIFGLVMLLSLKIPWLNFEARLKIPGLNTGSYLRSFFLGAIFPVAWIPCTSWVLGGILALAAVSETALYGAYLLAVYSLGFGIPFLLLGIAFNFIERLINNINKYTMWIYVISGLLLIGVGILVLTDKMFWFQSLI